MRVMSQDSEILRGMAPAAAGTDDVHSGVGIDMQASPGAQSIAFAVLLGTITATAVTTLVIQQSDDDASADDYSTIDGTEVTIPADGDDSVFWTDIIQPAKRWVRCQVIRETANAVIDGGVAVKYNIRGPHPVAQSATGVKEVSWQPSEA